MPHKFCGFYCLIVLRMVSLEMRMSYSSRADSTLSRKCAGQRTVYTQEPLLLSPYYPTSPPCLPPSSHSSTKSTKVRGSHHSNTENTTCSELSRTNWNRRGQILSTYQICPYCYVFSTKSCFAFLHMELKNKIHLIQGICLFDYTS